MSAPKVSIITEVVQPFEDVELSFKLGDGSPAVVRCEFIPELEVAAIMQRWAGEAPPGPEVEGLTDSDKFKMLAERGRPLIERGTMMFGPDGSEVRPAFYFDDGPRHPLSIPGRYLKARDVMKLTLTLFRLTGYAGGVASAGFPDAERERSGNGVGTGP